MFPSQVVKNCALYLFVYFNLLDFIFSVDGVSKEIDSAAELKSPISLVYELALKRNLEVVFDTVEEKGPPHMRIFVTKCHVGDAFETVGEGNSKKASKKKAAEKMLEDLKKLPITTTINPSGFVVKKKSTNNKKKRNLIKVIIELLSFF